MRKDNKPYKRIQGKVKHESTDEEQFNVVPKMTTEEWNAKLEEKRNAIPRKTKDKKRFNKVQSKVIHGTTLEEQFKELYGMTLEEWHAENVQRFIAKTGMTPEEWYIKKSKSTTPIDHLKARSGTISEDDKKLVEDLEELGLIDGVINVLLDYAVIVNRNGLVHPLVREMGKSWIDKNIVTIEKAIVFVREELEKNKF